MADFMLTVEEFKKNFPPNVEVPKLLLCLLEFQNQIKDWYSGYFELANFGREGLIAWFDDEIAASQFIQFGHNADGSLYCFWLYNRSSIDSAPIVFLGSEGQDNAVLANNLEEFFALLAEGYEELGFSYGRLEKLETETNRKFREWLKKEFTITPPVDAEELIANAQANHPNLEKWIEQSLENKKDTKV
jgi:hypothetical protein